MRIAIRWHEYTTVRPPPSASIQRMNRGKTRGQIEMPPEKPQKCKVFGGGDEIRTHGKG
jgi:hypothetical protein